MEVYYFDTSGLLKRYVREIGSAWVRGLIDPRAGHSIRIAAIAGVEIMAAVTRRERGRSLSPTAAALIRAGFMGDLARYYRVSDITPAIVALAMSLAEKHALRGYDAVQLAAAIDVQSECRSLGLPMIFISSDTELNTAASAEGLVVDDPNAHP